MKTRRILLVLCGLAVLLIAAGLISGISFRSSGDVRPAAEEAAAPTADALEASPSLPEPDSTPAPSPTPEPTPEPTPDLSPLPDDWFDDAAFFGDSITILLEKYCIASGDLGEALFLGTYSYSVSDALTGDRLIWYQNSGRSPQNVVALSGAKKIFLMLGNNDLAHTGELDSLMENWAILVSHIREESPEALLFIESSLPVYRGAERTGWNNELFDEYNDRMRSFCQENDCVFVELAQYFKDENNCLAEEYCSDQFCHLTQPAVAIWVEQLKNPENYSVDPRSVIK